MVQKMTELRLNESGAGNNETDMFKQPIGVKKIALRDLHNENNITGPKSTESSPVIKEKVPVFNAAKVSSTKRHLPPVGPQSPPTNTNPPPRQLVYVRRKSEPESGKKTCNESTQTLEKSEMKEPKDSYFPAFAPSPVTSLMNFSSEKTPAPVSLENWGSEIPPVESKRKKSSSWEERGPQLEMLLKELDNSKQEAYLQLLRSSSFVELSGLGLELEKRAIQLSFEEGDELERMVSYNVLGKDLRGHKPLLPQLDQHQK